MQETILIKLGELVLKGLNRKIFEAQLLKNIRRRLMGLGEFEVKSAQSTIYVIPKNEEADLDAAEEKVGKVFGIVSYSRACVAEKDMAAIQQAATDYLRDELMEASTFKVESKRSDKKFAYTSPEISREVGAYLLEQFPIFPLTSTTQTWKCGWRSGTLALMFTATPSRRRRHPGGNRRKSGHPHQRRH